MRNLVCGLISFEMKILLFVSLQLYVTEEETRQLFEMRALGMNE